MITHRTEFREVKSQYRPGDVRHFPVRVDSWYLFGVVLLFRKQMAL